MKQAKTTTADTLTKRLLVESLLWLSILASAVEECDFLSQSMICRRPKEQEREGKRRRQCEAREMEIC